MKNDQKPGQCLSIQEYPYTIPRNWVWLNLMASFDNVTSSKKKVQTNTYLDNGSIAVVDQSQKLVGGYTNDKSMMYSGQLPVIVFGDHTRCIKYVDFPFAQGADGIKVLLPKRFFNSRAFYYSLQAIKIPNLGYRRHFPLFPTLFIPLPPLAEQQRIVDRIESLFAKLDEAKEKAQAVVNGYEDRKAAILHKAFSGELAGVLNHNVVPLSTIVETVRIGPFGSALHKEDYISGGVPVINPKHILGQHVVFDSDVTITKAKAEELNVYKLRTGDIIMGRRGEMGRCAPVTEKENGWLCGTGSLIIRLQPGYDPSFYSAIIASSSSVTYLEENCVGSTMKNLNERVISSLPVPVFTADEQKRTSHILTRLLTREQQAKDIAETVICQIDTMKKAVLARAFRGELGTNDPNEEPIVL